MCIECLNGCGHRLGIGYDEGTIVIKLGKEVPVASMDTNTGERRARLHSMLGS
jgi:hypothetical protein